MVTSPSAIDQAEEQSLACRAATGDGDAVDELLRRYRPFVRAKARAFFVAGGDREDVVQEGMIGLYKAVRDFEPDSGASFRSFADLCIRRQILTAVKTATRRKHAPLNDASSLDAPGDRADDDRAPVAERLPAEPDPDPLTAVLGADEVAELERRMAGVLSELEVDVLERYVAGASYQEIADALGRRPKAIDNALQRIKRKVDAELQSA